MKLLANLATIHPRRILLLLLLVSFGAGAAPSTTGQKLAAANTVFAFKLVKQLTRQQPGTNLFISPCSVSTVLQMACNGAGGLTREEMQRALGIADMAPGAWNEAQREWNKSIAAVHTNILLTVANAIWYQKGIRVRPEFMAGSQEFFGATVDELDFTDPRSIGIMDAWANEKTHGRIPSLVGGIDPATRLFLANAVYFKGKWLEPFAKTETKDRVFHLRGGRRKQLPMMHRADRFSYRRGTGFQAVRLPYQGWDLAMYVFLPDPDSSVDKLLGVLNGDSWQRITQPGFAEREGTVVLPRFRLEYSVELKPALKALGMKLAFGDADFSGMSDTQVFISAVRQKSFVEVNEEGTEAAAVTGLTMKSGIEMNPPKPFQMIVDRPFFVMIHRASTQTILFMGVVFDPGESS